MEEVFRRKVEEKESRSEIRDTSSRNFNKIFGFIIVSTKLVGSSTTSRNISIKIIIHLLVIVC